jgi:hypothetical protein
VASLKPTSERTAPEGKQPTLAPRSTNGGVGSPTRLPSTAAIAKSPNKVSLIQAAVELSDGGKTRLRNVRIHDHGAAMDSAMFGILDFVPIENMASVQRVSGEEVEFTFTNGGRRKWALDGRGIVGIDPESLLPVQIMFRDIKTMVFVHPEPALAGRTVADRGSSTTEKPAASTTEQLECEVSQTQAGERRSQTRLRVFARPSCDVARGIRVRVKAEHGELGHFSLDRQLAGRELAAFDTPYLPRPRAGAVLTVSVDGACADGHPFAASARCRLP